MAIVLIVTIYPLIFKVFSIILAERVISKIIQLTYVCLGNNISRD